MDPRFLKWMGETLCLYASNVAAVKKMAAASGMETSAWARFGEYLPRISPPPFSYDKMDECYREWLSFLGAVPKSDLDALKEKVTVLEEECEQLRQSLDMLVQALSGVQQIPVTINQWVDLAKTVTAVHREWLKDFRSHWDKPGKKEGEKYGRNSK
ncbi:MAG TPA: hypothetical protein VFG29_12425 [Syntrophales bacterium]|nr:hypothetical protein [Syntrophales bacterium]